MRIIAVLLMPLLVGAMTPPANATEIKTIAPSSSPEHADHRGPASIHRDARTLYTDPRTLYPDPRTLYRDPRTDYPDPRTLYRDPAAPHRGSTSVHRGPDGVHRRHDAIHRNPVIVVPQPIVVVAPRQCHEPGYWAYSWVPQSYVSNVWIPGHYDVNALWIEGRYEPRAYAWGYYQPYWVPERWSHC
jgi:hypothetical protein